MVEDKIYQGESLGLLFKALADDSEVSEDVSGYDFELLAYTSALGHQVLASTIDSDKLPSERRGDSMLFVNIPHEVTKDFNAGPLRLEVMMVDRTTGVREIAQRVILQVVESKIGKMI